MLISLLLKPQLLHFQSSIFIKKLVHLSRKDPQKFQKSDFINMKVVKIDPKSFEIKSLKISASLVSHNKRYSNLKNREDVLSPPPVMSRVKSLDRTSGKWFLCNDLAISETQLAPSKSSYVLFYVLKNLNLS